MRYPASEKLEIIRLVEQSHLPVKCTLEKLGIPHLRRRPGLKLSGGGAQRGALARACAPERERRAPPFAGPDVCLICPPSRATMSQKSSLPQPANFVS